MKNNLLQSSSVRILVFGLIMICFQSFSCSFTTEENLNYEWKLTFEDNFDSFDRSKWLTSFDWGNRTIWSNKELQWYKDENVFSENGVLKIVTKKESVYGKDPENEKQFEFTSGMINTPRSFKQAYGKWEMKVRFPFRKGFWPAFWLIPEQKPGLPEIDIFEYFGIEKNEIASSHHWGIDFPNYSGGIYEGKSEPFFYTKRHVTKGDFADRWMVWTFECYPDKMLWKLDGNIVYESKDGIPTAPMYVIANVAVKDNGGENSVDYSDTPYVMEIDYVRVYKMVPKR